MSYPVADIIDSDDENVQCYLCGQLRHIDDIEHANVDLFGDTDTIFFCKPCFLVAPWRALEAESKISIFVSATHLDASSFPNTDALIMFPRRQKYLAGTNFIDAMNGKPMIESRTVAAVVEETPETSSK